MESRNQESFRKGISSSSIVKNNSRERKTKLERERKKIGSEAK